MELADIRREWRQNIGSVVLGMKIGMAYKFEFIVGTLTTPISLFIYYFLWKAIYAYSATEMIRGYTFDMLINYFVLSMLVGFFAWANIDQWMEHMIIHGEMIVDLVRPMEFMKAEFYFDMGMRVIAVVSQAIPLVVGAQLILGIIFISWKLAVLGIISLFLAWVICFLMAYLVGMSAFWLNRISGLRRMKRGLMLFLSGGMIPISFFPAWFISISHYLPFEYIRYVPINIYLGQYSTSGAGFNNLFLMLGLQVVWIVILLALSNLMWNAAIRKFSGAGT